VETDTIIDCEWLEMVLGLLIPTSAANELI
jgi:hypothetical protein